MSAPQARRIRDLENEIRQLQQALAQRPRVLSIGASASIDRIVVYGGNTLADSKPGIAKVSPAITDIPNLYDPNVSPTCINGIGYGDWYHNGVFQAKVLICNDGTLGTAVNADLLGDISGGSECDVCTVAGTKTLTVAGDPNTTVTVYVPDIQ